MSSKYITTVLKAGEGGEGAKGVSSTEKNRGSSPRIASMIVSNVHGCSVTARQKGRGNDGDLGDSIPGRKLLLRGGAYLLG